MKTAISIPDDLFAEGEELARKLGVNRSALYSRALRELVERSQARSITNEIDRVLGEVGPDNQNVTRRAARKQFERAEREE